ncbi:DUF3097 domain-containing protein [Kocuria tytonis]|uniref:DUF3097 domain-containing protein n=1 Tax=Kocuria tytonis TaxID=2054280 RepID=A0A495AAB8_9MICC|nr:DUF3097 domain-containing protein [Kocuria tytonis]RKQ36380.1 DUF3097 domain-containing protein [Kocuria tytonis]
MNAPGWGWGPQDLGSPEVSRSGPTSREVAVAPGLVLEDVETGWVGAVVSVEVIGGMRVVGLEDRHGRVKTFPLGPGFLLDGEPVRLTPPAPRTAAPKKRITASGSVAVPDLRASVAKESRVWVEGYHDAELVAKVWGHDLAVEGIVVEPLHGIDDLPGAIAAFGPGPQRRLGILVDHLVPGSKESRIAEQAVRTPGARENVLILGHPYVDIWQAVKPAALGIPAWPVIPRGVDWKTGMARALGLPHRTPQDVGRAWQAILSRVSTYADLEPALLGRVEELIDFLTAPGAGPEG